MKGLAEMWASLPPLVRLAIIVIVIFIIYKLVVRFNSKAKSATSIAKFEGEKDNWKAKGEEASYPPSTYTSIATSLYAAMDSDWYNPFSYGTGEEEVYAAFERLNNNVDFIELQKAFGVKDGYSLDEWIYGDLGQSEIDKVNKILKARDIQYQF